MMNLSVAYTFEPGIIGKLAGFPQVKEIYGCRGNDFIGSGRSSYTLRPVSTRGIESAVREAHAEGVSFNYLLNAASLYGMEQTREGNRLIRRMIDRLSNWGVDAVTVSLPYLMRIVKKYYPAINVRVGAFAVVDSPEKARQWEDLGADTICLSAIACNRDFERLSRIRSSVQCDLQLIANASCMPSCAWENTHMHLLTQGSMKSHRLRGFCFDYCFVQCSRSRLRDKVNFIRSIWIRPEDLPLYEQMGYRNFKLVERSCPGDLLLRRVAAYCAGKFGGNLWELVAPVAWISRGQKAPLATRLRMLRMLVRPRFIPIASMLALKRYSELVIPRDFSKETPGVFIDNNGLDGFIEGLRAIDCGRRPKACVGCDYCAKWAQRTVSMDAQWQSKALAEADKLHEGVASGELWGIHSAQP
jgi:collagenase-like PrtC family protease